MRYTPESYAKALINVLSLDPLNEKEILVNFRTLLEKNRDLAQADKIIQAVEMQMVKDNGGRMIELETARALPDWEMTKILSQFKETDRVKVKINPGLVAGTRVTIDGETELNLSLDRKLRTIFK